MYVSITTTSNDVISQLQMVPEEGSHTVPLSFVPQGVLDNPLNYKFINNTFVELIGNDRVLIPATYEHIINSNIQNYTPACKRMQQSQLFQIL